MSWGDIFWIILILIVLFGCSTPGEVTRKNDSMKPSNFVELNTGAPSSVIRKKPHTYAYEVANAARSEQFIVTSAAPAPTPPQRALRLDLARNVRQVEERILAVHFGLSSWELGPDKEKILTHFVQAEHPKEVDVTGYTCWLGSKKYNNWLALKRAKVVASRLRNIGVKVRSVTGKGKCCYIDRKNPAPNRRAEVKVLL